jgi:Concanavalin A-like lectin/glucanases superfamily
MAFLIRRKAASTMLVLRNKLRRHQLRYGLVAITLLVLATFSTAPNIVSANVSLDEPDLNALWNGLVAYWPFDGNTTNWNTDTTADVTGDGYNGTLLNMSADASPVIGKIGQALSFDGVASSVSANDPVGAGTVTACAWLYMSAWPPNNLGRLFWTTGGSGGGFDVFIIGAAGFGGGYDTVALSNNTGSTNIVGANYVLALKQWDYTCAVRGSDGSGSIYVNGVEIGSGPAGTLTTPVSGSTLYIGGPPEDARSIEGTIDDVRIYNRALSLQEIQLLYAIGQVTIGHTNTSLNIGLNAGLVGEWISGGQYINWRTDTITDTSGNDNTGQMVGMSTSTSPVPGRIGEALKFGNSDQYVTLPSVAIGTTNTVVMWVYVNGPAQGVADGYGTIIDQDATNGIWLKNDDQFDIYNGSDHTENSTFSEHAWHQLAEVDNAGSITFYLDGKPDGTASLPGFTYNASEIGDDAPSNNEQFNGELDDLRIYDRALSAQEVAQLYAAGHVAVGHVSGGYDPATIAWVNAVTTAGGSVSAIQESDVNNLITCYRNAGIFSLLDREWLLWADDEQQAQIDIIHDQSWTSEGANGFTADAGYTGDGSTSYLDTGFNPPTADGNFLQNSASMDVYITHDNGGGADIDANSGDCTFSYLGPDAYGGGAVNFDLNGCSFPTATATNNDTGLWSLTRTDASTSTVYKDGTLFASSSDPTSGLIDDDFYIEAQDESGTTGDTFGSDTLAMVSFGGGLTSEQETAKAECDDAYATSKGFNVF